MSGLFLHNGRIYTDKGFASSLYCLGSKIVSFGKTDDISSFVKKGDIEMDLKGKLLLPSFTDCHTHFTEYAISKVKVDFSSAFTFDKTLEAIKRKIVSLPHGKWITGWGWNKNIWPCKREPHKKYLDELSMVHPIALDSKDGHCLWCNTRALEIAGIGSHPDGLLYERDMNVVKDKILMPDRYEYMECVKESIRESHKIGLTGVHICEGPFGFGIYEELFRKNELNFRITWHFPVNLLDSMVSIGIKSGFGNEYLRIGSVKIFADGSLGSRTAYMFEPYEGLEHCGTSVISEEELEGIILKANKNGISCAVHAIGDRANNMVLHAFEKSREYSFTLRNRIEHVQLLREDDIRKFGKNNIIASLQPAQIRGDIPLAEKYWGERSRYAYPFNSLLKSGGKLVFGSDVPVETHNPFLGLYGAVCRTYEGKPWYPQECISLREAINAYTVDGAYSSYEEHIKGSIAPGMLADFILLDRDIFSSPPDELLEVKVDMTVFGGEAVFVREPLKI